MSIQTGNLRFLTCFIESFQAVLANYSLNNTLELRRLSGESFAVSFGSCLFQAFEHFSSSPGGFGPCRASRAPRPQTPAPGVSRRPSPPQAVEEPLTSGPARTHFALLSEPAGATWQNVNPHGTFPRDSRRGHCPPLPA